MAEQSDLGTAIGDIASLILRRLDTSADARKFAAQRDAEAIIRRRDPKRVPGSQHFASMLAYGHFILAGGPTIVCDAIPGISGVQTSREIGGDKGRPAVRLRRILTHFHFDDPAITIEQNPTRDSTGELIGADGEFLPGRSSFSQFLILTLQNRPLANRDALVMTADRVDQWPPIGSTFVLERPTDFYPLDQLDNPSVTAVATLAACKAVVTSELDLPLR